MAPPQPLSALVVIDYQNIHLTAHQEFSPAGLQKHETLIHPLHFANQVLIMRTHRLAVRSMATGEAPPPAVHLDRVQVFRGCPSNKHSPTAYRRSQAQKSEWTRDRRVEVEYRTLRYLWDPVRQEHVPSEKGIDVMAALAVVRAADRQAHDLIILASHDSDLEPALEVAIAGPNRDDPTETPPERQTLIETAGWGRCHQLRVPGVQIRHTSLGAPEFVRSRDRKDYT